MTSLRFVYFFPRLHNGTPPATCTACTRYAILMKYCISQHLHRVRPKGELLESRSTIPYFLKCFFFTSTCCFEEAQVSEARATETVI